MDTIDASLLSTVTGGAATRAFKARLDRIEQRLLGLEQNLNLLTRQAPYRPSPGIRIGPGYGGGVG